ncbi:predicted protein [Sclerotinia sclerotiorum 1980 UF-70]|uniref:Uncharacterized protein n=1 Tax=Sclerotinia sclerotiorum (strain ATCC 18683 / 1980 / Ss-1) TaxID=665079 RepID=A7EAB2_SCLS1|nr:predicted protein [Sclerotinia sclerotiorum 1980 UF-70]EDN99390.1 predicted protein [Sclerotinia sclerotiorum 1980 UF-70]
MYTPSIHLNHSTKHNGNKALTFISKNVGTINDAIGDNIVKHLGTWYRGKYIATKSELRNLVTVENGSAAASRGEAIDEGLKMLGIVSRNVRWSLEDLVGGYGDGWWSVWMGDCNDLSSNIFSSK